MDDEELEYEMLEYFDDEYQEYWRNEINRGDWEGCQRLHDLLESNKLKELCGQNTKLFLMADGESILSMCMLSEKHNDELNENDFSPWIGYVFTFPSSRGKGCAKTVIEYACRQAKADGAKQIHVLSELNCFYEKLGFEAVKTVLTIQGKNKTVYKKDL